MQPQINLFDFFRGIWFFSRRVTSLHDNTLLQDAAGHAIFTSSKALSVLSYREEGLASDQAFHRNFLYDCADTLSVLYDDGPRTGQIYQHYLRSSCGKFLEPNKIHVCGEDRYSGRYEFTSTKNFTLTTDVTGRNKNFKIVTNYLRA